ncbi:MAG: insulinase family protein [Acidobacteria bacterium]|nr:insulinase family protein [Acidobacteriota bacterium]
MPPPAEINVIRRLAVSALLFGLLAQPCLGQTTREPEREQLLNGLRLLIWSQPNSPELLVKLRLHSGAAFDLAGKSGQMALLGDLLFPDAATVDYFTDELGGKLDVSVNYDSVTITMVGKASELEQVISVLRNAILSTQFTPEVVTRIRDARLKALKALTVSPAVVADRAIAVRLFDEFPYGRHAGGTPEDLARVDRADLMLAHERFFGSNNATLAIVGGVTKARAFRTVRQLLGPWRKSDKLVPATFTQPKSPDPRTLIVNVPGPTAEVRLAVRGLARAHADFLTSLVMARLAQHRWQSIAAELANQPVFVRSDAYVLPGAVVMGAAVSTEKAADALANARKVIESLISTPATVGELDRAKAEIVNETVTMASKIEAVPDPWLDADTYRLSAVQDQPSLLRAVSPADIQRVATRVFKDVSIASVVAGESAQLKAALQGRIPFEVLGEIAAPTPSPKPPAKPASSANPR